MVYKIMTIKILKNLLVIILIIGLMGCTNRLGFPTDENGFPMGFTRASDGAQVYLGMYRDDVVSILGEPSFVELGRIAYHYSGERGSVQFGYNEYGIIIFIEVRNTNDWIPASGLRAADIDIEQVQYIFESGGLSHFYGFVDIYTGQYRPFMIIDHPTNPVNALAYTTNNAIIILQLSAGFLAEHGYPYNAAD